MIERRSRNEILLNVLESLTSGGLKKTHIMYQCNLSWSMVNEAIVTLSDKSLLTLDDADSQRKYKITQKGLRMLELHRQIQDGLSKSSSNIK
jgi:predicted transcriptional regulator